jgi:hypothetical protein
MLVVDSLEADMFIVRMYIDCMEPVELALLYTREVYLCSSIQFLTMRCDCGGSLLRLTFVIVMELANHAHPTFEKRCNGMAVTGDVHAHRNDSSGAYYAGKRDKRAMLGIVYVN